MDGWASKGQFFLLPIRSCANTLYTSTPAQKLMSTEELVKRTVALEEISVPDQPRVRSTIVAWLDNPVQCRKDCGDEGFSPSAEWQRKRGMATDLWCMKCSKRGIKLEQSESKAWKASAVHFPVLFFWSPIPLHMEPQPRRHPYPSARLMFVKDACSQPKCEMA